jgi:hypothetical protein
MSEFRTPRDHRRGPSDQTRAWVEFIEQHADWFIGARKRWREGDPPARSHRFRVFGSGAGVLALVLAIERLIS